MARSFRVYQKKRGHRRTGSRKLGGIGEAVFFAFVFLLGCAGLALLFRTLVVPEWRVNNDFIAHTCIVRGTRIAQAENGPLYSPEIQIEYQVNGVTYKIWTYALHNEPTRGLADKQAIVSAFTVGQEYRCWYDPLDPGVAVLVRGHDWWTWLMFIVPVSFIVIGGGSFVFRILHLGTSAERRAAIARRAARLDLFDNGPQPLGDYPYLPDGAMITDSPGTKLAFRLPIGSSAAWFLFWLGVSCVLWNATVAVFVVMAVNARLAGTPDWRLTACLVPFVLGGIGLLAYFVRELLVTNGIGPTLVEISHHPLIPGSQYALYVSQSGRLRVKSLEVLLTCEEEATYRQGTHTRTEKRCVFKRSILRRQDFEVHRGVPFDVQCQFEIPARAMHSFKADHNEINWKLVVKGSPTGWPEYERAFPVVVYPGDGGIPAGSGNGNSPNAGGGSPAAGNGSSPT